MLLRVNDEVETPDGPGVVWGRMEDHEAQAPQLLIWSRARRRTVVYPLSQLKPAEEPRVGFRRRGK